MVVEGHAFQHSLGVRQLGERGISDISGIGEAGDGRAAQALLERDALPLDLSA